MIGPSAFWNKPAILSRAKSKWMFQQQRLLVALSQTDTSHKSSNNAFWYSVIGGLAVTTVGGLKYAHDHMGGTEGLVRSISFYSFAIPKYIVYRYHLFMDSPDAVWDKLHEETSEEALVKILDLQGFYIKCGQMCASNIGNAFPRTWQDTMSVLQDEVPPQDFSVIKEIVSSELDFDNVFSYFDPKPIGSASIGQVHRAILRQGGEHVVVKVRYPKVEQLLKGDVRTIKAFAQVAQPVHVPALEEVEKQFQTEFDYRDEAKHLQAVRENLNKAGLIGPGKLCQVPKPYLQYCTKQVLVMEELNGGKLAVELRKDVEHHAIRAGMSPEEFMESQRIKALEHEKEKGEPFRGPSAEDYNLFISLVDSKRRMQNAMNRLYNTTVGWLPGNTPKEYKDKSSLPLNCAKLIDDLLYIHGHEVLVDGLFNGDPHPGNILLCRMPDGSPQLGLIDYGQVKRLSKQLRHLFCKIIIALDNDDREQIINLMKEAGFRSKNMDPEVIYLYAKVGYDQDNKSLTKGLHIQMFMEELQRMDPIYALPVDFIAIGRASLILRGLAHALHQSRSIAKAWRPIAERVLQDDI